MPDPFISRADLTAYLGRDVTADDGALIAVDSACEICREIAEQDFNAATDTVRLDGSGTDCLILPQRPVSAAGTVTVNGTAETAWTVTPTGMLFRGSAGVVPRLEWPRGRQNIEVTYDHGYAAADLPTSVRMVALALASRLVVQGVAQSETVGDVTVAYAASSTDLTDNELRILIKHRQAS